MPGLDLVGEGRGCNEVAGAFTIDELVVQDGRLVEFEADFEVHCEGREPAARGHVRISETP